MKQRAGRIAFYLAVILVGGFIDCQADELPLTKLMFIYTPDSTKKTAALSFHLTNREKEDIGRAVYNQSNTAAYLKIDSLQKSIQHKLRH